MLRDTERQLRNQCDVLKQEKCELANRLRQKGVELTGLTNDHERTLNTLKANCTEKDRDIIEQHASNNRLQNEINMLKDEKDNFRQMINKLRANLNEKEVQLHELERQNQGMTDAQSLPTALNKTVGRQEFFIHYKRAPIPLFSGLPKESAQDWLWLLEDHFDF
jgi:hypothetical protein